MLNIVNKEHFDHVVAEAERRGILPLLQKQLDYLSSYACFKSPEDTRCNLGYDFAPLSFAFMMQRRGQDGGYENWFNGGLIFHPGSKRNERDQSFSCEVVGQDGPHWSVHT